MRVLPLLPLKGTVVFPGATVPLAIGNERSLELVAHVAAGDRLLVVSATQSDTVDDVDWADIYEIGTLARIHKLLRLEDGTLRILVEGVARVKLERRVASAPYLVGEFEMLPDTAPELARVADFHLLNVDERQRLLCEADPKQLVAGIVRREEECERLLQPAAETVYAAAGLNVRSNCTHALFDAPV